VSHAQTEGAVAQLLQSRLGRMLGLDGFTARQLPGVLSRDLLGGIVSFLVTLSFGLSFAAMIFTGDLAGKLPQGISMALMCAGVTIIVIALYSPFYFAIAGPDSRPTAVQSTLAVSLVAVLGGGPHAISLMMVALAGSTVLTGAALYMFGSLGMGRWIRYVPHPVISGFLASTGWVLTIGGVRVMLNLPLRWDTLAQLAQPLPQQRLIVGLAFTVVFCLVLFRSKHFLWLPSLLISGTLLTHVMLALRGISVAEAQQQGWLLLFAKGSGVWLPYHEFREMFSAWQPLKASFLWAFGGGVLVLITVSAIGALVTAAAIELSTGTDADLDRELKAHGAANVLSGMVGGLVGCNAIVRSALNRQAGAASRLSGVLAGVLCLVTYFLYPQLMGLIARPVMGATLMYLGLRLLIEWAWKSRHKLARSEYLLVLAILVLIMQFGFVIGLLVGLIASCITFAINYSRVSVIKNAFTADEHSSKVQRSAAEARILRERGSRYSVLRLRGYLFFGSIINLIEDIRHQLATRKPQSRGLVLDFQYVTGMDTSSAHTFLKLRQTLVRFDIPALFCSMRPEIEELLRREKCLTDDKRILVMEDMDHALEWCEQHILAEASAQSREFLPMPLWLARELGGEEAGQRFLSYVETLDLNPGDHLFRQGDKADEIYVIASGRVGIFLDLPNRPKLRLRSVTSNTTLGEMAVYRQVARSASVICEEPTCVYRVSRAALSRMEDEEPKLAIAFHCFVVRTLADRLVGSDRTIAALER
jgi:SulP family sulfate permease